MSGWMIWNPAGNNMACADEQDALENAKVLIQSFLEDSLWSDEVEFIEIRHNGVTTHKVKRIPVDPPEIEEDEQSEAEQPIEYCDYVMVPATGD
jgi:hypothetical protein